MLFSGECLMTWIGRDQGCKNTCPYCRAVLFENGQGRGGRSGFIASGWIPANGTTGQIDFSMFGLPSDPVNIGLVHQNHQSTLLQLLQTSNPSAGPTGNGTSHGNSAPPGSMATGPNIIHIANALSLAEGSVTPLSDSLESQEPEHNPAPTLTMGNAMTAIMDDTDWQDFDPGSLGNHDPSPFHDSWGPPTYDDQALSHESLNQLWDEVWAQETQTFSGPSTTNPPAPSSSAENSSDPPSGSPHEEQAET